MDIFDYWMERRKARASNSWRDTEVHAVLVDNWDLEALANDYDGVTPTRIAAFRRREPVIAPTFEQLIRFRRP